MRGALLRAVVLVAVALAIGASTPVGAAGTGVPLVDAIKRGNQAAVRELITQRVDVNKPEADGTTALHWAVRANDLSTVTLLLRAGARPTTANRYGIKPLTLAAINGNPALIDMLLKAGADPDTANPEGETALMAAARTGSVESVKLLAARGAKVNLRESWLGETALMWAASENHAAVVRALAELGADLNARSTVHESPVLEFPRSGGPNSPLQRGGWTALMYAARDGALDAARALAELGANLDGVALPQTDVVLTEEMRRASDRVGTTALVYAIINVHYDLAAMLLEKGADPNVADSSGMAALYAAVDMNSLQWVQGRPAPILTDKLDGTTLVKLLLERGADPNARLKAGPLKRHHDAGSTLNFGRGTTPLMRAARTNDVAVMRLLLDAGADPFQMQPDHTTTLMIAAGVGYNGLRGDGPRIPVPTEKGAIDAVQLLLDRGVDVNAFNDAGQTALHGAVARGDLVVKFLAEHGADLTAKNKVGQTPLDLALGVGGRRGRGVVRESTAALLRQLMAKAALKDKG
jgi:ankyrin repeat protein